MAFQDVAMLETRNIARVSLSIVGNGTTDQRSGFSPLRERQLVKSRYKKEPQTCRLIFRILVPTGISIIWDLRHKPRQKIQEKAVSVRERPCLCGHHWLIASRNNSSPISWLMPAIYVLSDLIRIDFGNSYF